MKVKKILSRFLTRCFGFSTLTKTSREVFIKNSNSDIDSISHEDSSISDTSECGYNPYYTEGLNFSLLEDGESYSVSSYSGTNTNIVIPSMYNGKSVTSIGDWAFEGCSSLKSIEIPSSVTSIGSFAFEFCSSLTSIEIPSSVTSIGSFAFEGCSSLTSIEIPSSVTSISSNAFGGCSSLTSITIPDSVTSIGDYAFEFCSSLTSITIPDSVTSIGNSAFSGCSSLTSITIPFVGASLNGTSNTRFGYIFGIGFNLSDVPSSLKEVIITKATFIDSYAFKYCSSLTSIEIPSSVTSIGFDAFYGCSSLKRIEIPSSVTSIVDYAFYDCGSLTTVYYKGTKKQWNSIIIGRGNFKIENAKIYYNYE